MLLPSARLYYSVRPEFIATEEGTAVLRRLQAFLVLGVFVVSIPAAAEEPTDKPTSKDPQSSQAGTEAPTGEGAKPAAVATPPTEQPPAALPPATEVKGAGLLEGWQVGVNGYFRAPISMGISSRPGPDQMAMPATSTMMATPEGPHNTQVSYGPNRTVDSNYYSFAYTRLQEQDWAEVFTHARKKHVDAAVGWMGFWFQAAASARNFDAAWVPGLAYLALDTDFEMAGVKPNIALTVGAWWPKFGYFEKYDTYTLGRFRQVGEQLKLTVPVNPDLKVTVVQGFGTGRDGSFIPPPQAPPFFGSNTGLDLLTYENVELNYKKYLDVGLHYSTQWTADPQLTTTGMVGDKSYAVVSQAHLTVVGAEATLTAPYAGRLWISPSFVSVRNGWALGATGTEVMHSLGGIGVATNYLGWTDTTPQSTGSGSMFNLGFLYENTLSGILGERSGSLMPEVTLNIFGLLADASLDLPAGSTFPQKTIEQFKYGADVTVQALNWLAFMLRYDLVNYDLNHPAYIFSSITPRAVFSSHFLSGESIYIQYSRYIYGDKMVLAGTWPWGAPLVAGSTVLQEGPYAFKRPDEDVVKLQATVAF
jgi:hypothetical protein